MFPDNLNPLSPHMSQYTLAGLSLAFIILYVIFPKIRRVDWRLLLLMLLVTNFLDHITTIIFVSRFGPYHETNDYFRDIMVQGNWHWAAIMKLGVISIALTGLALLVRRFPLVGAVAMGLITTFFLAALHNFVLYLRFLANS